MSHVSRKERDEWHMTVSLEEKKGSLEGFGVGVWCEEGRADI